MTKSASTPVETSLDAGLSAIQRGDYQEAAALLRPMAQSGDKQAQYQMGVMAADGLGQIKDLASAKEWLRRAADQGFAPAKRRLEQLQNPPSRVAWQMNSATESGRQVTAAVGIKKVERVPDSDLESKTRRMRWNVGGSTELPPETETKAAATNDSKQPAEREVTWRMST